MWGRNAILARLLFPSRTGWRWRVPLTVIFTALAMTAPSLRVILSNDPPFGNYKVVTSETLRVPGRIRYYTRTEYGLFTRIRVEQREREPISEVFVGRITILPSWSTVEQHADFVCGSGPYTHLIEDSFGWPFRMALYSFEPTDNTLIPGTQDNSPWWNDGWPLQKRSVAIWGASPPGTFDRFIPLRPIWPGVLGNAAFFGAGFLFLLRIPTGFAFVVRRARKRLGHCPHCSYRLIEGAPPGCPECGWGRVVK